MKVDIETSVDQNRTVIKPGIDRELDEIKGTYDGMEGLLNEVAENIARSSPDDIDFHPQVLYFPQLGFNIAVAMDTQGRPIYDGRDEAWERVFSTENRVYFKDFRMRELDERFGDVHGRICGEFAF